MKQNNLKYETICFLYAYLRFIDLSLDRSRWGNLEEFKSYFKSKIGHLNIEEYLPKIDNLTSVEYVDCDVEYPSNYTRMKLFLKRQFNIYQLSDNEIQYFLLIVRKLMTLVNNNSFIELHEIDKIRVELSYFTYNILGFRLHKKDKLKLMHIEHYLQSEILNVITLESLM